VRARRRLNSRWIGRAAIRMLSRIRMAARRFEGSTDHGTVLTGCSDRSWRPLDETSASARAIAGVAAFAEFVSKANDRIEVVAGDGALYAFVGKPPKAFGLVWFTDEGRLDVRSAMERGLMSRRGCGALGRRTWPPLRSKLRRAEV